MAGLIIAYYGVFGWWSWETCSFLMEDGGGVDLGRPAGGGKRLGIGKKWETGCNVIWERRKNFKFS